MELAKWVKPDDSGPKSEDADKRRSLVLAASADLTLHANNVQKQNALPQ